MSRLVTWSEVYERLSNAPSGRLFGVPRGGAIVAGLTGRAVDRVEEADFVVDDVLDSGKTARHHAHGKPVWSLFDRDRDQIGDRDIVFPWDDQQAGRHRQLERIGVELLTTLGYDPSSPHLVDTPARWARWWEEFIDFNPGRTDTSFDEMTGGQLVVVGGIKLWSVCEHHLLPFHVDVHIGYVPSGRVLGLSKFVRVAQQAAHRLQVQERLINEVAAKVEEVTGSSDIAVVGYGRHACMEARGVRMPATTATLVVRGSFETNQSITQRFLAMTQSKGQRSDVD